MKTISRRRFLRGVLGGATVFVGLPYFEAMLNSTGTALADGGGFPRRFGLYFWGNGVLPARWVPAETGAGYALSEQLEPLASIRDVLTVITGTEVKVPNLEPHWSGASGILTGRPLLFKPGGDYTMPSATVDQLIAAQIGNSTRFRSIEFGAKPSEGQSYNGPDNRNPAESSPFRLYERIFGAEFREPGSDAPPDPTIALRRSALDSVMTDIGAFQRELGASDRARLDQHLTSVRELELRLARLAEDPVTLAACTRPEAPLEDYPDLEGRPQLAEANRAMCDIIALALACDQTRVFSNFITSPLNNLLLAGSSAGHHQLTHDEPGDQPQVNEIVKLVMGEYAYLVEKLRSIPEGDGTLLDHSVVLGTTDISYGRTHGLGEFPILYAGTADGRLVTGQHIRSELSENASSVMLSLMRSVDAVVASYGTDDGFTDRGFAPMEA